MADSLARKAAQQDDLLSKLDSVAREFDNYDYGLPMGEENLEQMRAEIDKYDAEALAPMREALQATSNALLDAEWQFVGLADYLATCNTDVIVEDLETTIAMLHQAEKSAKAAVARAAEVLKGDERCAANATNRIATKRRN